VKIDDAAALLLVDGWHVVDEGSVSFVVWGYDNLAAVEWTEDGQVFRARVSSVLATRGPAP
jgi:hypothetical protein